MRAEIWLAEQHEFCVTSLKGAGEGLAGAVSHSGAREAQCPWSGSCNLKPEGASAVPQRSRARGGVRLRKRIQRTPSLRTQTIPSRELLISIPI